MVTKRQTGREMDPITLNATDKAALSDRRPRSAPRENTFLTAKLRVEGGRPISTRVRNVSAGGLMAEYAAPLMAGTPVEVTLRGIGAVTGVVAWSTDGRIGVSFDRPVDPGLARRPAGRRVHDAAGMSAGVAHL